MNGAMQHTVTTSYDTHGRRATKKVTTNGSITLHQRYIYRGYLQIACCDLTRSGHPCLWLLTWDPTQPITTRPLAIRKDGTWYAYGWDLTKNICEVFGPAGYIRTAYAYTPYGEVSTSGDVTQPIQWSSEYLDLELALVYYNYRHYDPLDGRWLCRDIVKNTNEYKYLGNNFYYCDYLGASDPFYGGYSLGGGISNRKDNGTDNSADKTYENGLSYMDGAYEYLTNGRESKIITVPLKACSKVVNYANMGLKPCEEKKSGTIEKTIDLFSPSTMDIAGPGRINVKFDYTMKLVDKKCNKWEIEGTFSAKDNVFDFNHAPYGERDGNDSILYPKENITRTISVIPAIPFTVRFLDYSIKEVVKCP